MFRLTFSTLAIIAASTPNLVAAETFPAKNDLNRRPVRQIASELGIAPKEFSDCFLLVTPAKDFNPTKAEERANKARLLPCLQAANTEITNDQVDRVMDKYRGVHISKQ